MKSIVAAIPIVLLLAANIFAQPATRPISTEPPYRGLAVQISRTQDMAPYEKCIDEIKDLGADTVDLAFTLHQKFVFSVKVHADADVTPTPEQIGSLVDYAHARGIRVLVAPTLVLDDPVSDRDWRGTLHPDSWDDWFASYQEIISRYATAAQAHHAEIFCLGAELVSSERHVDSWRALIKTEREIFKGRLTYQSNWDRYWEVEFWNDLDLIAMNSYWTLSKQDDPTVDELCEGWDEIKLKVFAWQKKIGKPILLTEAGWCPLGNAAQDPWDYTQTDLPANQELQRRLYEAFFRSWQGQPNCAGFLIWEWPPKGQSDTDGKGYTPRGKLAEAVVREWLKKDWKSP